MPEFPSQVDKIFQEALDLAPEQRSAYLDQACAGDEDLRHEVESLVSSYEQSSKFMETPVIEIDAAVIAGADAKSEGRLVGHYQIIRRLGVGGMGEVYLASDTRTDRKVALKVLPNHLLNDEERVRRFQQEARAALALNHPNIVTIFEIGEANGEYFIASEWIQGETLRARIDRHSLSISESLDITIQVAAGLTEAHSHGIVHRDIKPENVMLRPDGYVKVLDFGIAKLTDLRRPTTASEDPTALKIQTAPQMVLGTLNYMSPEQARAQPVDERTDTWSLGVLLYEMVAGHPPFGGETSSDVMAAILEKRPAPLARFSREAPEALEDIVTMALAKNRDERYQTATQMMAALRRLKQRIELASELEASEAPAISGRTDAQRTIGVAAGSTAATVEPTTVQPASSAEFIVGEIKRHRRGAIAIFGVLILLAVVLTYGVYRLRPVSNSAVSFQSMTITRLTTSGRAADGAISPDGKYVAYLNLDEGGRMTIWLRQVATSSNVKIVDSGQKGFFGIPRGLTFSPDGNYLYYRARTEIPTGTTNVYALFRIPVLGGDSRKVIDSAFSPVSFSPDARRIAFARNNAPVMGESYLIVANADGTEEHVIDKHKLSEQFTAPGWPMGPVWTPDGKRIVCASGVYPSSLIEVQVDNGAERQIGAQHWANIDHLSWLPDGSALLLTAQEESSARFQIWQVSYPSGEARRITNDLNSYRGMSLTADSATMAVVQTVTQSDIWVMPYGKTGEARAITSGKGNDDGYHGLSWTPAGRLVYASSATGSLELWSIDSDGGNQKQLTSDAHQYVEPMVTPDGRYIVFFSTRTGPLNLWRMDADGGNLKPLTTSKVFGGISCSPDGKFVVYTARGSQDLPVLWKIGIDGGEPVQLTDEKYWAELPTISPDGKKVAFQYFGGGKRATLGSIPIEGGQITDVAELQQRIFGRLRWTPDGSAIAYDMERGGTQNIWAVPLAGGAAKQLTDLKDQNLIFSFDWSKDGKQLALSRGTQVNDVVLISNFR